MQNLQGIISTSVNNATLQFEKLGQLTTDVANYNTPAYKSTRFENYLKEDGRLDGVLRTDYSTSSLASSDRDLDIAIDGPGFVPITMKNGKTAYTRNCSFMVGKEGILQTSDGSMVADGIKIPVNTNKVIIDADGTIKTLFSGSTTETVVGKIPVVNFNNPEKLQLIDGNKVVATNESGNPILLKNNKSIKQKCLETSNVNMYATVNEAMRLNASLIASTRLIKYTDDLYQKAINLKQ
ncbi:MAG: flagellar hook basal-body protein [Candidatus Gastranaerophilaceae bacterium]|jgi:flagellar basal body rod protein FlgG